MRRKKALLLLFTLLISVIFTSRMTMQSYAGSNAEQIIQAIGIMNTDKDNSNNETEIVVRSRFAQMLINLSALKDTVSSESNMSLFSDVKKSYWAAGYIQTVIDQGWMSGYLDGKFKPEQGITLQEAVYAAIKLLGYADSDFASNLSGGIMNLYKTKELNKNINKSKSQYLTEEDCMNLFYNTLTAKTKSGNVYAAMLGYKLDADGELDYLSIVNQSIKGPIIADDNWKYELPFSASDAKYYKNGLQCALSDISDYDVLYFCEELKTVWVYDNKVTGKVEAINPDYTSPASVTVAGKDYALANNSVTLKFTSMGSVKKGNYVTLLLDRNDKVAGVITIDEQNVTITGVVLETGTHLTENSDGSYTSKGYVKFVDASGNVYEQDYDNDTIWFLAGGIVRLTFKDGSAAISSYTPASRTFGDNTFSSDGSALGGTALASNVKILDLKVNRYISLSPERLAGVRLLSTSVYYYELNEKGQITQLILNDISGDMDEYGIFVGSNMQNDKISYTYLIGDKQGSLNSNQLSGFSLSSGPKKFTVDNGIITGSTDLTEVSVVSVGLTTIQAGNTIYPLADQIYIYFLIDGEYFSTSLDKISDLTKYSVKAYYDKNPYLGGKIRVLVAENIK